MRKLHYLLFAMIMGLSVSMTSCSSDDDDAPVVPGVEFPEVKGTLAALKELATGADGVGVEIADEIILEGTVVSNPATMNLPKGLFIQVGDAAIKLSVDDSGVTFKSLQVGQKVFLKAQGLYIGVSYNVPVIGEGADDKYKVGLISDDKLKAVLTIDTETVEEVTPKVVTIPEVASPLAMVGTVVSIEGVQFTKDDQAKTYYSGDKAYSTTNLIDAEGNKIAISTYNAATFGSEAVKGANSGTVTAILSIYGGKPQLVLRSVADLDFTAALFEEAGEPDPTTDSKVYFSEYAEGSSSNKYVEIYNASGAEIDLANYTVRMGSNGGDWGDVLELTGKLADKAIYVIGTDQLDAAILDKANLALPYPSPVHFNGDDAVGLFKKVGEKWSLCDVIGVQGEDPGDAWAIGNVTAATKDHTLIRKEETTVGNPDWATAANEWIIKDKNYWTSIGIRGEGEVTPPEYNFVDKTVDVLAEAFDAIVADARVSIEGWFTEAVVGAEFFGGKDFSGDKFVEIRGYQAASADITTWMVTPGLNLDAADSKKNFSFDSKRGYTKAEELKVFVSSNFDYNTGVDAATWTELTVTLPAENGSGYTEYLNSGVVDLSSYSGKVHVAFKYVGNNTDKTGTWRIDNVKFNYTPGDVEEPVEPAEFSNWGFEDWTDNTTPTGFKKAENITKEATTVHGGSFSAKQQAGTKDILAEIAVEAGSTYEVSYWFLDNDDNARGRMWSYFKDAAGASVTDSASDSSLRPSTYSDNSADWQQYKFEVTVPAGATKLNFEVRTYNTGAGSGVIYYDDFAVVKK